MTSSFGNIIGTPRDQIPKLPVSNYADSTPDLTQSVEERNEEHKRDLEEFFNSVTEIETLRHNNLWDNITGLEKFSASAADFVTKRNADKESRKTLKRFKNINDEELLRLSSKLTDILKLEKAERINQLETLVREGNPTEKRIALDLLNQNVLPTGEEIRFKTAAEKFDGVAVSTYTSLAEKNYLINASTLADAELIGDNAIRDILTDVYYELTIAGFDINSRQVQSYINRQLLPSLLKENKNQLDSWKSLRPQIVQQNRNKDNVADILEAFTRKGPVTRTNDQGVEETSIEFTGDFNNLLDVIILRNPTVENKGEALIFMMDLLESDPTLKNTIKIEGIEYFLNDAVIIDDTQNGKEVKGFLNTKANGVVVAERFFMKFKSDIADTNSKVFENIRAEIETEVREYLAKVQRDTLDEGEQQFFATKYINLLDKRGLSTNLPLPAVLKGDETITNKWSYNDHVTAIGFINTKDWENAYKTKKGTNELPLTINSQIEKAKAELTQLVLTEFSKDDNANIDALVEKYYPEVLDKLTTDGFVAKIDTLRPLLPSDTDAEITSMLANTDQWMNNKEVNSIYEKRFLDVYLEKYMKGRWNPADLPTYIKKLAAASKMTPHQYVMSRIIAMGVYDEKTKKFVSDKNPEDIFNLTEEEKQYLFIKPLSSKNLLLWNGKEGGLNGEEAKKALLLLRTGNDVDYIGEGRNNWRRGINFINPRTETKTVAEVLTLVDKGFNDFGLYGFQGEDLKKLVEAGILDPNADFDENTQDFAAWGLMYIQANSSNSVMGAQTEALDWRYLVGLNQADQATVLQFFPNLEKVPINQFQNLQKDVSNAILTDVEDYTLSTSQLVETKPELAELFKDNDTLFKFIRAGSTMFGVYDEELANDPRRKEVYEYFQGRIKQGKYVPGPIRRILHLADGKDSGFNYFRTEPMGEE